MTQPNIIKPEWKEVHNVTIGTVVCTVKQSNHKKPHYSFDVTFFGTRGEPCRWYNIQWTGDGSELKVHDISESVSKAVLGAQEWIRERMVQDYWDVRAEYEAKKANWEKQRPTQTGTHQKGKAHG